MNAVSERSSAAVSDEARSIVATRVFDAPRDLVWKLWTDPVHLAQWWGPRGFRNTIHKMDVRPGGEWNFIMHGPDGTDYANKIIYTEIAKPERIAYDHLSGPLFHSTVTFEKRGEKTAVTVKMVFATAAEREKVARDFGAVEGLDQTLDRLGERLSSYSTSEFVISRVFDVPRDLMFRVWTEGDHLAKWWGPKGVTITSAENDLRPGGIFHYQMRQPGGETMWGKWVYREIVKPERLVFVSSFSDEKGGLARHPGAPEWPIEILATITFAEQRGKTIVTVFFTPINPMELERQTFETGHLSMQGGWSGTFERLEEYLRTL